MAVKRYYLLMVYSVVSEQDHDSFETDMEEYETDMKSMLEVGLTCSAIYYVLVEYNFLLILMCMSVTLFKKM